MKSEDALKAVSSVKKFNGRPILVLFAKRRQEEKMKAERAESEDEDDYELQTSQEQQNIPKKSKRGLLIPFNTLSLSLLIVEDDGLKRQCFDIGRVVVLEGLEDSVSAKHLRVRCRYASFVSLTKKNHFLKSELCYSSIICRKIGEVESIEYPVPGCVLCACMYLLLTCIFFFFCNLFRAPDQNCIRDLHQTQRCTNCC